jgi:hypothetical protein
LEKRTDEARVFHFNAAGIAVVWLQVRKFFERLLHEAGGEVEGNGVSGGEFDSRKRL